MKRDVTILQGHHFHPHANGFIVKLKSSSRVRSLLLNHRATSKSRNKTSIFAKIYSRICVGICITHISICHSEQKPNGLRVPLQLLRDVHVTVI